MFLLQKKTDGFCNSHSVPAFCLRTIAKRGEVLTLNAILDNPLLKEKKGINNAGTFQLLCRDCDSRIFADYENPYNYESVPTQAMLGQIALKNYLKLINKRKVELQMSKVTLDVLGVGNLYMDMKQDVNRMDLEEYVVGYNKARHSLVKNDTNAYHLCYYKKLGYTVPIAFQASLALVFDLEGNLINNIYCRKKEYKLQNIHLCVFPLDNSSIVMMFVNAKEKRYRKFYKQLNKLSLEEQLNLVTYIMFMYSEDMYFSDLIYDAAQKSHALFDAASMGTDIVSITPDVNGLSLLRERMAIDKYKDIPNLLGKEYRVI